ncbi:hypothetical protein DESPIGER_1671 [Desulfovibrio piger]|uniref:Uncharacterized protein n=1 Tax=Desulfovibrio piger TaxID=901 RepID=A0A1K1LFN2_9BACT|nr:hypothetical protein DESPIGER_1671 [Desulfovibrio piger]
MGVTGAAARQPAAWWRWGRGGTAGKAAAPGAAGPRPPVRCLCVRSMFFHTQKAGGRKHLSPVPEAPAGRSGPHSRLVARRKVG